MKQNANTEKYGTNLPFEHRRIVEEYEEGQCRDADVPDPRNADDEDNYE